MSESESRARQQRFQPRRRGCRRSQRPNQPESRQPGKESARPDSRRGPEGFKPPRRQASRPAGSETGPRPAQDEAKPQTEQRPATKEAPKEQVARPAKQEAPREQPAGPATREGPSPGTEQPSSQGKKVATESTTRTTAPETSAQQSEPAPQEARPQTTAPRAQAPRAPQQQAPMPQQAAPRPEAEAAAQRTEVEAGPRPEAREARGAETARTNLTAQEPSQAAYSLAGFQSAVSRAEGEDVHGLPASDPWYELTHLPVSDLEVACDWYRLLGFRIVTRVQNRIRLRWSGASDVVIHQVGGVEQSGQPLRFPALSESIERLLREDLKPGQKLELVVRDGQQQMMLADPDGNRIQLFCGRTAASVQPSLDKLRAQAQELGALEELDPPAPA